MLTENEIEELYDEVSKPYTQEELKLHREHRTAKNELEVEHAYNYEAIDITEEWLDYLKGNGEKPDVMIWRIIRPTNHATNDRCRRLDRIVEYFGHYDYGNCPRFPIVVYCSRSSATLMRLLDSILPSPHLTNAEEAIGELIAIVSNFKTQSSIRGESFVDALTRLKDKFIDEIRTYSFELGDYLRKKEDEIDATKDEKISKSIGDVAEAITKGSKKIAEAKLKKRGKHAKFPIATQEAVFTIWERERKNETVRCARKGLPKYEDVFLHGKLEFMAAGVESADDLRVILKARSNRVNRSNEKMLASARHK